MKKKLNGFTLSETLIVVVVLGIIATLTIPALVNKNKESVAKTKVRKAMAAYESALNKMIIENDLKSDDTLTAWAGDAENNCANSTNYFKKVQGDGCVFKTSDGIWWDISNIERPLIAFKDIDLTVTKANDPADKTAFVLVGRFGNDGSLRVDDLAYETANSIEDAHRNQSKAQVEKLYTLLGMKKAGNSAGGNTTQSPFAACNGADTCVVNGIEYKKMTLTAESATYDYCDPEDWDENNWSCGENDDKWKERLSESEEEDIYVAIEESLPDYDDQAQNLEGSTCTSCSTDYYNAAKRYCESSGGSLATMAQLESLANQGKFPSNSTFWAFEEFSSNFAYYVSSNGRHSAGGKSSNFYVLCIGK